MYVSFAGVKVAVPSGWLDITDDLDERAVPTLAREDGIGAIQFSVALHKAGEQPGIDEATLHEMLAAKLSGLANLFPIATEQFEPCTVVGGKGLMDTDTVGAWYVSDGENIAFITYVGEAGLAGSEAELADARAIVHSIRFPSFD